MAKIRKKFFSWSVLPYSVLSYSLFYLFLSTLFHQISQHLFRLLQKENSLNGKNVISLMLLKINKKNNVNSARFIIIVSKLVINYNILIRINLNIWYFSIELLRYYFSRILKTKKNKFDIQKILIRRNSLEPWLF